MKSEKEIRELYDTWKKLKEILENEGDIVSLEVARQSGYFIKTFEWILDIN